MKENQNEACTFSATSSKLPKEYMRLIRLGPDKWKKAERRRAYKEMLQNTPFLPSVKCDMNALLKETRTLFPDVSPRRKIYCHFMEQDTLAYIRFKKYDSEEDPCFISIHQMLNQPLVPVIVFRSILIHELIHLVIRPREIEHKMTSHPPEFREMEQKLFPKDKLAWAWVQAVFGRQIKHDKKRECIHVKKSWKKMPLLTVEHVEAYQEYIATLYRNM